MNLYKNKIEGKTERARKVLQFNSYKCKREDQLVQKEEVL
jgi:hypothetical protein